MRKKNSAKSCKLAPTGFPHEPGQTSRLPLPLPKLAVPQLKRDVHPLSEFAPDKRWENETSCLPRSCSLRTAIYVNRDRVPPPSNAKFVIQWHTPPKTNKAEGKKRGIRETWHYKVVKLRMRRRLRLHRIVRHSAICDLRTRPRHDRSR